jgi:tripartite-type tricarboxylate transporter receptor subunit TctC
VRDLVGGHIDALYVTLPGVAGSVRGGNVIPVAVSSPKRSKAFPDVPTFRRNRGARAVDR